MDTYTMHTFPGCQLLQLKEIWKILINIAWNMTHNILCW